MKLALAVMSELPAIPNVTLLLLLKTTVPDVAVCVPAAFATAGCVVCAATLAVICELPLMPNVTPFELTKLTVPDVAVCVPAPTFTAGWML